MLSPALMPSLPAMPLPPIMTRGMHDNQAPARVEERLPFSVRVVSDAEALDKAGPGRPGELSEARAPSGAMVAKVAAGGVVALVLLLVILFAILL